MIENRCFIFTGLQPWDVSIGSNAIDIAKTISKHNKVLYINTPLDYITYKLKNNVKDKDVLYRREVVKKAICPLRKINDNLYVLDIPFTILPINKLPDGFIFDGLNYLNNWRVFNYVKKYIKKLLFIDPILITDNDIYRSFYANEFIKPVFSVYYRRDNMVSPFWAKHAKRLEPKICAKYNLVATNSDYLAKMVEQYNPKTYCIGQGVDLDNYDININYNIPQDIINIKKPIIGYTGWITSLRLDADLIFDIASNLPNYSFVFVGSQDEVFMTHKLNSLKNVHFLGLKPAELMPNYISYFDIGINPQIINDITQGNYPRKIDEYLSLGKKVVATKTCGMEMFSKYVWICGNSHEYIRAIEDALKEDDSQLMKERIEYAKSHSWENSVNKLYEIISNNLIRD